VYNGANYVGEAIDAILDQTYSDLTLVISDNASIDETPEICQAAARRDPRVVYIRQPTNLGAAPNYNVVLEQAPPSDYFVWIAHDDQARPRFVERCVEELDAHPHASVAFPRMVDIDAAGSEVGRAPARPGLTDADPVVRFADVIAQGHRNDPIFGMVRRDVLEGTTLHGSYSGSDRTLLAELALRGPFVEIDEPLFCIRQHAGRSVHQARSRWDIHVREAWFDTTRADKIVFPKWRRVGAYLAAVRNAPGLSGGQRMRASGQMVRWFADRNWKTLALELGISGGAIVRRLGGR
jgi:glycosyltransferase involved in cell wall biosynthesis